MRKIILIERNKKLQKIFNNTRILFYRWFSHLKKLIKSKFSVKGIIHNISLSNYYFFYCIKVTIYLFVDRDLYISVNNTDACDRMYLCSYYI